MPKLSKYDSFQALKLDTNASNTEVLQSAQHHEAMEKFIALLRQNLVKKTGVPKENPKIKHGNGQQFSKQSS